VRFEENRKGPFPDQKVFLKGGLGQTAETCFASFGKKVGGKEEQQGEKGGREAWSDGSQSPLGGEKGNE